METLNYIELIATLLNLIILFMQLFDKKQA